ncbi:MAG: toprim domain-containing protein [Candidatus Lokiarchaeota archaeon]|nr:toprim domain-containing protein [Candidatus Lokiarchaeota archaeon]
MIFHGGRKLRDNERKLIDLLSEIDKKYNKPLIIVEGKRDKRVLRDFGIKSPIFRTQGPLARPELVDEIVEHSQGRPILILTDFDDEGVEICHFLERELEIRKIKILRKLRRTIRKLMRDLRCIEELVFLFKHKDSPTPE